MAQSCIISNISFIASNVLGSWAEKNVDPALFSRELVANVSSLVGNAEVPTSWRQTILILKLVS